ncbi:ClpX C4-type zinc finger protein [Gemmatirosa kalamazoonensis]|uniref:ClpX C4-type zinc finger protein n=1 Tax=Gemmatirosa kalamazoonensis TaxID=861299 RepID=UPI000CE2D175
MHSRKGGSVANTTERVRRFAHRVPCCRVCRLPSAEGRRLIAGPSVYICESCIASIATRESAAGTAKRCSFCGRRDVPIPSAWPSLAICAACLELARGILAEGDRRSRPAT